MGLKKKQLFPQKTIKRSRSLFDKQRFMKVRNFKRYFELNSGGMKPGFIFLRENGKSIIRKNLKLGNNKLMELVEFS